MLKIQPTRQCSTPRGSADVLFGLELFFMIWILQITLEWLFKCKCCCVRIFHVQVLERCYFECYCFSVWPRCCFEAACLIMFEHDLSSITLFLFFFYSGWSQNNVQGPSGARAMASFIWLYKRLWKSVGRWPTFFFHALSKCKGIIKVMKRSLTMGDVNALWFSKTWRYSRNYEKQSGHG